MNVGNLLLAGSSAIVTFCLLTYRLGLGSDGVPDAEFEPVIEAEMPEGFPAFTPVGAVEVKQYPKYRKAVASARSRTSFWTLFSHIKRNGISMTSPVEMGYDEDGDASLEADTMAFLYGDSSLGQVGRQGGAEVQDVPEMLVVSTGVRGSRTDAVIGDAKRRLDTWLNDHPTQYERSGPVRVMAYNSPFVPRERNFFEVQIPIRRIGS